MIFLQCVPYVEVKILPPGLHITCPLRGLRMSTYFKSWLGRECMDSHRVPQSHLTYQPQSGSSQGLSG